LSKLGIEIVAAESKAAIKQFIELPYELHRDNSHWVPPLRIAVKELLDREKHPFYANAETQLYLAMKDGRVAGRVAAIVDRAHNRFHQEKAGFFGFYESADDVEVAQALLAQARSWVKAKGAEFLRGPVNPSTNYECGTLVEGFDSDPMIMMTYNPPYYPALMDKIGLRKCKDLYAYLSNANTIEMKKIDRVADRVLATTGKEMKQILKPELVLIGELGDRVVGFALALPDVNQALKPAKGSLFPTGLLKILYYQRLIHNVRVLALGVVEEYRTSGLAAGFYATLVRNARKLGFGDCEMSWILEDNTLMNRSLEVMGAKRYKTYRIYEWN